jgi:hypothetical protein
MTAETAKTCATSEEGRQSNSLRKLAEELVFSGRYGSEDERQAAARRVERNRVAAAELMKAARREAALRALRGSLNPGVLAQLVAAGALSLADLSAVQRAMAAADAALA